MQNWIIAIINQFGYLGITLLIAVENIFPPIPSEIILTFGGFLTTYTDMNVWLVTLFSTIGSVAGALVLYFVGRILSADRLERWLNGRIGSILHLKPQDVHKAHIWFEKKGKLTVFFCRFIPIVRSLISIPAGMAKMNVSLFLLLTVLGTSIWNMVLVQLGALAGASWEQISVYMDIYSKIALFVLIILFLIVIGIFYQKRVAKKNHQS